MESSFTVISFFIAALSKSCIQQHKVRCIDVLSAQFIILGKIRNNS